MTGRCFPTGAVLSQLEKIKNAVLRGEGGDGAEVASGLSRELATLRLGFDRLFRHALKKHPTHVEAEDDHRLSGNHHKRQLPCDHQTHGESHCYGGRRLHQKS
ncbi:hypothetical protein HPP92_004302 [Vanilla planifolia]|uniref:Uncharacterized protein n=1 Tax=Vanilla planifolia TaxID=51239 RepID=A0A835RWG2_VANPL|nr:hypothetical protein HPP92_004302 [Vanilla planifolia]